MLNKLMHTRYTTTIQRRLISSGKSTDKVKPEGVVIPTRGKSKILESGMEEEDISEYDK